MHMVHLNHAIAPNWALVGIDFEARHAQWLVGSPATFCGPKDLVSRQGTDNTIGLGKGQNILFGPS